MQKLALLSNDNDIDIVCQPEVEARMEKSRVERTRWLWLAAMGCAMAGCSGSRSDPASIAAADKYAVSLLSESRFQAPPSWRWGTYVNADGARLRYGWAEPQGNRKGLIVLLPGYQTMAEEVFETCRDLLNAGYAIWVLDRRGQGGSDRWLENPQKSYSIGFEHDEHDVEQFVRQVVHGEPNDAHFLAGESLGGHIGLRVLHDYPGYFQAAAFSSPSIAFHTGRFPEALVRAITRFEVIHGSGSEYAIGEHDWRFDPNAGDSNDPVRNDKERAMVSQGWSLKDPAVRSGGATNAYVVALFRSSAIEQSPGWMESIRTPVLIGQVVGDKIAVAEAMSAACARMPACELIPFQGTGHALFSDSDSARSTWMRGLISFFDSHNKL